MSDNLAIEELTYCEVHPDRETGLRCNKCDRLMCAECAVPTPVGLSLPCECVRAHDDKFFSGTQLDYAIVFGVSAVLAATWILWGEFDWRFFAVSSFFSPSRLAAQSARSRYA